jgi:hypothetical protein
MYRQRMARKKNSSRAVQVGAFPILEAITHSPRLIPLKPKSTKKNAAALALGRLDARKSGKASARKLSTQQRRVIAVRTAKARWKDRS